MPWGQIYLCPIRHLLQNNEAQRQSCLAMLSEAPRHAHHLYYLPQEPVIVTDSAKQPITSLSTSMTPGTSLMQQSRPDVTKDG